MAPKSDDVTVEHRLTKVESDLSGHIQVCERNSEEIKKWVRFIGMGVLAFAAKIAWSWIATGHV